MLRPAVPDDGPAITAVTAAGFATYAEFAPAGWEPPADMTDDTVGQRLAQPGVWGVVAEDAGEIVAFGAFGPARKPHPHGPPIAGLAHVWAVFAAPSHWGTGAARDVLHALHDEMRRQGYAEARLYTPAGQARARRFYAREGWVEQGDPAWVAALGLDVVELRRTL